ncbi:MAG: type I DNA topoisomerase, partial [Candidatus Paceibacterota bacterium]
YNLSPFLWKKVARKLSAGRVQSVALRLIVEREREIKSFNPQEYWVIEAIFSAQGGSASGGSTDNKEELRAILSKIEDKNIEIGQIKNKDESQKIIGDLEKSKFLIENVTKKELKRNPSPPFTTSTLQQAAFARLKFSSKQTMRTAQALYEKGLITYMRTDSVNLSSQSLQGAKEWLKKNLGDEYCLESPRYFKNKSKNAQEAHEAIRPTRSDFEPEKNDFEDAREKKLYDLIWRRFVASQMPQAIFNSTSIDIEGNGDKKYMFKVSGSILKFDGFLKIWPSKFAENEIPEIDKNDKITLKEILPSQHFTEPLPRYNDASLVKTLEELGIGRPSTYASIISVIQERNYIIRNEQKRFEPTEIGEKVNDVLVENFPEVINVQFTAKMEDELDQVAQGKLKWKEIIREFYGPFEKNLKEKYETVKHQAPITETTEEKCEKCGKPMLVRFSRFGKFLGCSGFPECRTIKSLIDPNAHNNSPQKSFGKCPKCQDGEIVRRKTKKGRWFYGCSKYPDCDHASWKKPEGQEIEE